MANKVGANDQAAKANLESLNADELRKLIRDGLVAGNDRAGGIYSGPRY